MITPQFLKRGDTVMIVSPAGFIDDSFIDNAIKLYNSWGLEVVLGENVLQKYTIFAGTDEERLNDFQQALDNDQIRAIFCSRGGYGSNRIIEKLNFEKFIQSPKWIVGFSDITIFLSTISTMNICGIHGTMPKNFTSASPQAIETLRSCLFGEPLSYTLESHELNRTGKTTGDLVGGNLSIIYSLLGSRYGYDFSGKILFIEDLNEKLYHLDRMMRSLKFHGVLNSIKGLVIGQMSDMIDGKPSFERTAYEIIEEVVSEYNFPTCYNFPTGHFENNQSLIVGGNYSFEVSEGSVALIKNINI